MKKMHMAWSLVLSLSLASCVGGRHPVGPNYTRPVLTPAPFHNLDAAKAVKTELPSPQLDAWWTGFDDPMLVTFNPAYTRRWLQGCTPHLQQRKGWRVDPEKGSASKSQVRRPVFPTERDLQSSMHCSLRGPRPGSR